MNEPKSLSFWFKKKKRRKENERKKKIRIENQNARQDLIEIDHDV